MMLLIKLFIILIFKINDYNKILNNVFNKNYLIKMYSLYNNIFLNIQINQTKMYFIIGVIYTDKL